MSCVGPPHHCSCRAPVAALSHSRQVYQLPPPHQTLQIAAISFKTPAAANSAAAALNCRSTMVPLQTRHSIVPSLPHQCASSHCCPTCTVFCCQQQQQQQPSLTCRSIMVPSSAPSPTNHATTPSTDMAANSSSSSSGSSSSPSPVAASWFHPQLPPRTTPQHFEKTGCQQQQQQQQQQQPLTCLSIMVPLRKVLAALSRANMSSGRGSPGHGRDMAAGSVSSSSSSSSSMGSTATCQHRNARMD
jgi:hypothetical protein